MRVEPNFCYVLHNRPYRETSLLVEVFSCDQGRITLVVRGARTGRKNNKQSLLQPYQKILLGWYGKGEMGTVNRIEPAGTCYPLHGRKLISGFYINELVMRLLHRHEPHPDLFEAYEQALAGLARNENEQVALRIFEKQILGAVGFGLVLDHDIQTLETIRSDQVYDYQPDSGPSLSDNDRPNPRSVRVHGSTLISIRNESFNGTEELAEARKLMRHILSGVLGPKPLASRDLYRSYSKFS